MTNHPNRPEDQPPRDGDNGAPSNELLGLISPDRSNNEKWKQALEFVEEFGAHLQKRQEYAERCYFGEADKPRSRRTWIYSHGWNIKTEGYELTPAIAEDAVLLAANCRFELMLSSESPELGPKFSPDLIAFNGRGDAYDDFTYPPDRKDRRVSNFLGNRGRCRTQCRNYDTLVSAVLLSVKHHLGNMAYVTSNAEPDREGWQAAFELYSRTFPERELPVLDNWTQ